MHDSWKLCTRCHSGSSAAALLCCDWMRDHVSGQVATTVVPHPFVEIRVSAECQRLDEFLLVRISRNLIHFELVLWTIEILNILHIHQTVLSTAHASGRTCRKNSEIVSVKKATWLTTVGLQRLLVSERRLKKRLGSFLLVPKEIREIARTFEHPFTDFCAALFSIFQHTASL